MIGAPRALYTPPLMGTQSNALSLVDTVNGRVLSSDRMLSIVPHKHCYIVQVTQDDLNVYINGVYKNVHLFECMLS